MYILGSTSLHEISPQTMTVCAKFKQMSLINQIVTHFKNTKCWFKAKRQMQKHSQWSFESKPLLDFLTRQALLLQSSRHSCPNLHREDQKVREGERDRAWVLEIPIPCLTHTRTHIHTNPAPFCSLKRWRTMTPFSSWVSKSNEKTTKCLRAGVARLENGGGGLVEM